MEYDMDPPVVVDRVPCGYCGRKFNQDSLDRHMKICAKTSKPRPVFDSGSQRVFAAGESKNIPVPRRNRAPVIRQAKNSTLGTLPSSGTPPVAQPGKRKPLQAKQPDNPQCPHCLRKFNSEAAQRHIPFCAEQHKRISMRDAAATNKRGSAQAAARVATRQNYKPPAPKPSSGRSDSRSPGYSPSNFRNKSDKFSNATFKSNGLTKPNGFPASQRKSQPDWNSDIDMSAYSGEVRSRTGLRLHGSSNTPSNGEKERIQRQKGQLEERKTTIRKISSKNEKLRLLGGDAQNELDLYDIGAYRSQQVNHSQQNRRNSPSSNVSSRRNSPYDGFSSENDVGGLVSGDGYSPSFAERNYGAPAQASKFCHECGSRYPISIAKFCCECGVKRVMLTN